MSICAVFVSNKSYYDKFKVTCEKLRSVGNYKGDICLIVGDDLQNISNDTFIKKNKIHVKYFPDLKFNKEFTILQKQLKRPEHWFSRMFQFHKFYLFDVYFKQWNYIFYIDCGMIILEDVSVILEEKQPNTLLANRDGLDNETAAEWMQPVSPGNGLKLGDQFVKTEPLYEKLSKTYDITDTCFQTTFMMYDTNIITVDTFNDLYNLLLEYPISLTNDQGIISLYFSQIKPLWRQLRRKKGDLYLYDYVKCVKSPYVMIKKKKKDWIHNGYN